MGVYLSTANREVEAEEGGGLGLEYAAGGVQGWRKNMEDAHIAECDLRSAVPAAHIPTANVDMSLFAVFDGHGGKEVAKFCETRFCEELVALDKFKQGDYAGALTEAFHRMDIMLEDKKYEGELRKFRRIPNPSDKKTGTATEQAKKGGKKVLNEQEAIKLFQRLMMQERQKRNGGGAGVIADDDNADAAEGPVEDMEDDEDDEPVQDYVPNPGPPSIRGRDGTFMCNLADHRVNAGCTSVVVLRVGNKLICANAGDSRAVLGRANGVAHPLSEDHKPSQERERRRIEAAGGYINQVGRVNGNLNLTRSLGDLKYKQVPGVARPDQIITGEPDITVTELKDDDEFLIVACDGVWDCLTSQGSVDFVRERLQNGMNNRKIVEEVFDHCISDDPRKTQGIGGDNMTCIVVQLKDVGAHNRK